MPINGDIAKGSEIGRTPYKYYIYRVCSKCKDGKWLQYYSKAKIPPECGKCARSITFRSNLPPPIIGEIRHGGELGYKNKDAKYIYTQCPKCLDCRFVQLVHGEPVYHFCSKCSSTGPMPLIARITDINNPVIGDMVDGTLLGRTSGAYVYHACEMCGTKRFVRALATGKPRSGRFCCHCASMVRWQDPKYLAKWKPPAPRYGSESPVWKGGRLVDKKGYVHVKLYPDDFFYPMANKQGYVLEHRLEYAKSIGRCLQPWETVHHKTGEKGMNKDVSKLELSTNGSHSLAHSKGYKHGYQQGMLDGRTKQIEELKQEIRLLQLQIKQAQGVI